MKKLLSNSTLMAAFVLAILLCGCMKIDRSDCPPKNEGLSLQFSYTLNVLDQERVKVELKNADVFFYDADEKFIGRTIIDMADYDNGNDYPVPTEIANQNPKSALIWGNLDAANYQITDPTTTAKAGMVVSVKTNAGTVVRPLANLFYGSISEIKAGRNNVISLIKNTNEIYIQLAGIPLTSTRYTVSITGCNGAYDYDNNIASSDMVHYQPDYESMTKTRADQVLTAIHTILRIRPDGDLTLTVRDTEDNNKVIYENSLSTIIGNGGYMTKHDDWDRYDEHTIIMNFDAAQVLTSITVGDWTGSVQGEDL